MTNIAMEQQFAAFREEFFGLVDQSDHVVITSHFSPDDDSIGSVLSMYTILKMSYPAKDIRIIYTGTSVARYHSFANFDKIEFVPDIADALEGADLLIMLDGSSYKRFSKMPDVLQSKVISTIAIDHHAGAPDNFTLSLVLPTFSSNCEILFRVFEAEKFLTKDLTEYLLMGVISDTGSFSHINPSQSEVFLAAKVLLENLGTSIDTFRARYGTIPKRILPLLQALVKNTTYQSVTGWPDFQYTYIDRSLLQEGQYTDDDISAASHIYMGQYITRIEGYEWGFIVTPRNDGSARMSSRSLETSVNVRNMHERLGIGSGHDRAAGASFPREAVDREPKQCIVEVLSWMEHNAPLIG